MSFFLYLLLTNEKYQNTKTIDNFTDKLEPQERLNLGTMVLFFNKDNILKSSLDGSFS